MSYVFFSNSYAQRLGLEANGPNSKLSAKQLFKLALRLAKMYDLDLGKSELPCVIREKFPFCRSDHSCIFSCVSFLLTSRTNVYTCCSHAQN